MTSAAPALATRRPRFLIPLALAFAAVGARVTLIALAWRTVGAIVFARPSVSRRTLARFGFARAALLSPGIPWFRVAALAVASLLVAVAPIRVTPLAVAAILVAATAIAPFAVAAAFARATLSRATFARATLTGSTAFARASAVTGLTRAVARSITVSRPITVPIAMTVAIPPLPSIAPTARVSRFA